MKKCRPTISNEGGRNIFCGYYNDCLDYAIKKSWDSWNCAKCKMKNKVSPQEARIPMYSEDIAYYEFGDGFSSTDLDSLTGL